METLIYPMTTRGRDGKGVYYDYYTIITFDELTIEGTVGHVIMLDYLVKQENCTAWSAFQGSKQK